MTNGMKIEVQFFSRLRDLAGAERQEIELPEGATLGELLASVYAEHPAMKAWDASLLLAVWLEYARRDQVLQPGDAVSIMPPVQGG